MKDQGPSAHGRIGHIEHYCNENDFVAQFGTLYGKEKSNRFAGKVFKHKDQSGHLMNQHYLNTLFLGTGLPALERVCSEEPVVVDKGAALEVRTEAADSEKARFGTPGRGEPGWLSAEEGMGGTVEVLGRLWRYRNGGSP